MGIFRWVMIALFALGAAACGSEAAEQFCDPETVHQCNCSDGTTSFQSCLPDGSAFEPCSCFIGAPSDSGTSTTDTTTHTDTTPPISDPGAPPIPDTSSTKDTVPRA